MLPTVRATRRTIPAPARPPRPRRRAPDWRIDLPMLPYAPVPEGRAARRNCPNYEIKWPFIFVLPATVPRSPPIIALSLPTCAALEMGASSSISGFSIREPVNRHCGWIVTGSTIGFDAAPAQLRPPRGCSSSRARRAEH